MGFRDLIALVFSNLNRMRGRVIMTAMGVVIGTAAIVILISLASGLQASTVENFESFGSLNQIEVFSGGRFGGDSQAEGLTPSVIEELKQIEGVVAVGPQEQFSGGSLLKFNRLQGFGSIYGLDPTFIPYMGFEVSEGTSELSQWTILIGAHVADSFEEPTQSGDSGGMIIRGGPGMVVMGGEGSGLNPDAPDLYGQTIQLQMFRMNDDNEQETRTIRLLVSGVLEETGGNQDYSIYMSMRNLEELLTWSQGERPNWIQDGYSTVLVITEQDPEVALAVQNTITELGYFAFSASSIIESLNSTFLIIEAVLGGIASIALLVAAIGIANTMVMSVLERTREIGLMKAIGARNRDVLMVFIAESGAIGLLGGLAGVALGIGVSKIIDLIASSYLATEGAEAASIVATPFWLPIFAILFSVVIGLAAGIYPAFRAVQLNPVQALKYE